MGRGERPGGQKYPIMRVVIYGRPLKAFNTIFIDQREVSVVRPADVHDAADQLLVRIRHKADDGGHCRNGADQGCRSIHSRNQLPVS